MKRTPMKPGSGFKRAERPERVKQKPVPRETRPTAVMRRADGRARLTVPIPKPQTVQHEGYMRLVRLLACAHCGRAGPSQFCHSDEGKGGAIKSDCRFGWPGCGPHDFGGRLVEGCHHLVGTQRIYPKAERRVLEDRMSRQTRHQIKNLGLWPATLEWIE